MSLASPLPAAFRPFLLWPVLALIGFTATVAQIVLLRELMVVFYGNEISMGVMLACWLLWTAPRSLECSRKLAIRRGL